MGDEPRPEDLGSRGPPEKPARRSLPEGFPDLPPSDPWIIRRLIACRKIPRGNQPNSWSQDPVPTRFGPYPRPRPPGRLTEWRAVRAAAGRRVFILLCMAQTAREDFRAWLVLEDDQRRSVIERWEYHGGHTPDGIHSHSWCAEPRPPVGPSSIDAPRRLPGTRSRHRRSGMTWSKETFWIAACRRFAIALPAVNQDELAL
jgi:hypothetical protein